MTELHDLVQAVRSHLSEEDRRLLRTVYHPPDPESYDDGFDRVLERLTRDLSPEFRTRAPCR